MKKIRSFFSIFLALTAIATGLFACNDTSDTDNSGDSENGLNVSEYTIVSSQTASKNITSAAAALKKRVENSAKVTLNMSDDWYDDSEDVSSEKEILIGETDRAETASAKAKLDAINSNKAFIIEVSENKIVILGKNDDVTVRAVKYFAVNFVSSSKKEGILPIEKGYSKSDKADTSTIIFPENLVELKIGKRTGVISHDDKMSTKNYYYPTAVQLSYQKNEADNGKLIATLNSSEQLYRIMESSDDGASWKQISQVTDKVNVNCNGGRMPMLYELPASIGTYEKGTLVLAGTSSASKTASEEKSAIVVYYSTDAGKTWTAGQNVDIGTGRTDGEGVWEPCLIYEEKTGRLYCFYSDDRGFDATGDHDQKIVYKYTTDLVSWTGTNGNNVQSAPFEAVASSDSNLRPGMVSISTPAPTAMAAPDMARSNSL